MKSAITTNRINPPASIPYYLDFFSPLGFPLYKTSKIRIALALRVSSAPHIKPCMVLVYLYPCSKTQTWKYTSHSIIDLLPYKNKPFYKSIVA